MNSIRLQNFRSFRDTGTIELRPLTILVGANSSGKSSFLRFFPLMKQTGEAFSGAPLLWNGRYVDFGDISTVMRRGAEDRNIVVELGLPLRHRDIPNAKLALTLGEREDHTVLRKLTFTSGHDTCELRIGNNQQVEKLLVNGEELAALAADEDPRVPDQISLERAPGSFLPVLLDRELPAWAAEQLLPHFVALSYDGFPTDFEHEPLAMFAYRADPKDIHSYLVGLDGGAAWKQALASIAPNSRRIEQMRLLAFVGVIPDLLTGAVIKVSEVARSTGYVGPFRKAPDRFERKQELSVQQLDPSGDNLAMYLLSLSPPDRADFSQWAKKHFGFGLNVESTVSHVSILIEDGNQSFNLIDMGYGLSQVLPVILQCWLATKRRSLVRHPSVTNLLAPAFTAIEQPELHLHPRLQTNLADLFVAVVNASKTEAAQSQRVAPTRLLIETHSEPLISRLGELVSEGKLDRKDCSVLMFHKDDQGVTQVLSTEFDEDGMLSKWPPGFLSA